jgi:dipeptidyl aminopeptidase/acylaminoacyl peptidase
MSLEIAAGPGRTTGAASTRWLRGRACRAAALVAAAVSVGCSQSEESTPRGTIVVGASEELRMIYLISPSTGSVARVRAPEAVGDRRADLSPDGRMITVDGYDALWVFARRGGGARRIARNAFSSDPVWAPSGRELAFVRDEGLYTISASGRNEKRIFKGVAVTPDWSPAGDEIVFVRDPFERDPASGTGVSVIHSVRPDGQGLRPIVRGRHPDLSPDGSKLAFARRGDGVYVADMDGSAPRRIVANAEHPEWSPDGAYLAFTRTEDCESVAGVCPGRIFIVRASGGRARVLRVPPIFAIGPLSWRR